MKTNELKTVDIQAKEWFDRTYGNSYFAANVILNYGMPNQENFTLPLQYGYGNHYEDMAVKELAKIGLIPENSRLWNLKESGVIVRSNIQRNCLKRELTNI